MAIPDFDSLSNIIKWLGEQSVDYVATNILDIVNAMRRATREGRNTEIVKRWVRYDLASFVGGDEIIQVKFRVFLDYGRGVGQHLTQLRVVLKGRRAGGSYTAHVYFPWYVPLHYDHRGIFFKRLDVDMTNITEKRGE